MEPGKVSPALLWPGRLGFWLLVLCLIGAVITVIGYGISLRKPAWRPALWIGRLGYFLSALGGFGTFAVLVGIVYFRKYEYEYAFLHTGNYLQGWYRIAATWSAQEGSFLLWSACASLIGFLVMAKAGKYEARVMPFYVTSLAFLAGILLKQSPFNLIPPPTLEMLTSNPHITYPFPDGRGLTPALENYWMTIHPPTIFFGFASLMVPYVYSIAALIWKDYDGWNGRVMPYSLLSCATLGIGLMMGGYWAYETQGWHGFWAWDPVENASFFPWLAITALVHGAVVQKSRGGMARTNTFLGILSFWLFLLGTFLTRTGALAGEGADGNLLSVHAFDNIGKSSLALMSAMLIFYGLLGLVLWLARLRSMPRRPAMGETLVSRDLAFFLAVTLMVVACLIVTFGTTAPLIQGWLKKPIVPPKPAFYNMTLMPMAILTALIMGSVPWLAWKKTHPETFLRKLVIPWMLMLVFGFFLVFWVQGAERDLAASMDMSQTGPMETMRAWINPRVRSVAVVSLASLACLAALSNAMLAFRVFRAKPLSAGGWVAHVGIGVFLIGVVVSNTYERTERVTLSQEEGPKTVFGYTLDFEKMTGKPLASRPLNPEYDRTNQIRIRVTPPNVQGGSSDGGPKTFTADLSWYVHNLNTAPEAAFERMRWPSIQKFVGHDFYVGLAADPGYKLYSQTLQPKETAEVGPYRITYFFPDMQPGKMMAVTLGIENKDGKRALAKPALLMGKDEQSGEMRMEPADVAIPEFVDAEGVPGAIYLKKLDAGTRAATLLFSLPDYRGKWEVPLEVTFKPWVNLVWIGILIATFGTLLAMTRRALEARRIVDSPDGPQLKKEPWDMPILGEDEIVAPPIATPPVAVSSAIREEPSRKTGKGKHPSPKTT